jgi:hypothetical protein
MGTLTAGDDADDFQAITGREFSFGEFRGGDRLAVMLDHHAAGREFLGEQKFFKGTGNGGGSFLAVGDDERVRFHAIQMRGRSGGQGGVPIFPDWFISEPADELGDFPGGTGIGDFELAGGEGGGLAGPFAG